MAPGPRVSEGGRGAAMTQAESRFLLDKPQTGRNLIRYVLPFHLHLKTE